MANHHNAGDPGCDDGGGRGPIGQGPYVVRQGDCIYSIARDHGLLPDSIWNHPGNAELREALRDPGLLLPGDRIHIPDLEPKQEAGATEQRHRFRLKQSPAYLRLRLIDAEDQPRADLDYSLNIDGVFREGRTDREGRIDEPIAPNARLAILTIIPQAQGQQDDSDAQVYEGPEPQAAAEAQAAQERYEIRLGHTDPIDEITGLQERLINLGYRLQSVSGVLDEDTVREVELFQQRRDLPVTGSFDAETQDALRDIHES